MTKSNKCLFGKDEVLTRLQERRAAGVDIRADFGLACLIADNALLTQRDKGGADYSHHTTRVSQHNAPNNILMIIGKLHDVVEDSDWTVDDLRAAGFSERIVSAVDALTHSDGEKYFDSIERAAQNPDAVAVKLGDLRDNMSAHRFSGLPRPQDFERISKYVITFSYLSAIHDGTITPDTTMRTFIRTRPELDPGAAVWAELSDEPYEDKGPEKNCWVPPGMKP
ncbi:MAG: hypothetical protein KJ667_09815 [Alphaproteobacteria bacterium]|nr:hypothetical protein [Alphaproteobacteria bacterium]